MKQTDTTNKSTSPLVIFLLSDSSGETAETVAKAVLSQFTEGCVELYRLGRVGTVDELKRILYEISEHKGLIAYTFVRPDLKSTIEIEASKYGIPIIDILGPLIASVAKLTGATSLSLPGRSHQLDESYFRRIGAIDFAIRFDDGKNQAGLEQADVVLTGVSRTSKTPNCMYLAHHWGLKAANVPLIHGIEPPAKLFALPDKKIIGLTIDPEMLLKIRCTRANNLGISHSAEYTDPQLIEQEVDFARKIFRRLGCHIIDVSSKAIEETSSEIYLYLRH